MATVTLCDGTGQPITGTVHVRGFVIRREYCDDAVQIVDRYQEEIDALHERLAKAWTDELAAIRAKYLEQLRMLPDVPESADA